MTIAVAVVDGDATVFGADTRTTAGKSIFPMWARGGEYNKWSTAGNWAFVMSGECAVGDYIRSDAHRWLLADDPYVVCDSWRRLLIEHPGFSLKSDSEGGALTIEFEGLLVQPGKLWAVDASFNPMPMKMWAIGSGTSYALGAMATCRRLKLSAQEHVIHALDAACEFEASCGDNWITGIATRDGVTWDQQPT